MSRKVYLWLGIVALVVVVSGVLIMVAARSTPSKEQVSQEIDVIASEVRNPANLPIKLRVKETISLATSQNAYIRNVQLINQDDTAARAKMALEGLIMMVEYPKVIILEEYDDKICLVRIEGEYEKLYAIPVIFSDNWLEKID